MKKTVLIITILIILVTATAFMILNQPKFGQLPKGERLERIKKSPNFKDGEFKNMNETPVFTSDKSQFSVMMDFIFKKKSRVKPEDNLPFLKTDIKSINPGKDVLVWFGHSSYFFQLKGKTFLVDPVFSGYASPFSFINKAFKGTNQYDADDFPSIDYLIITHDHWDHLDYPTIINLKDKIKHVICPLGVGQHFEFWGFDNTNVTELDWYEDVKIYDGWQFTATPARHFSGRGLKRNKTLWASFALNTPDYNLFIGGDGGYDTFFPEIGEKYGPFDLAILEQGQYNQNWNLIHMMPDNVFKAAQKLQAGSILPVHNSKFALASHPWDEPLDKITENHVDTGIEVWTPKMGEPVLLKDSIHNFTDWWKKIK